MEAKNWILSLLKEIYRKIYDQGVEPKVFINDFLELIYYFKNINSLSVESTNFSLNDHEFEKIKSISQNIEPNVFVMFWQFTIKTLDELDVVSNQHLSIEMFLMRLMFISSFRSKKEMSQEHDTENFKHVQNEDIKSDMKIDTVNQIKNVIQEKTIKPETQKKNKTEEKFIISSFKDLLDICAQNKEIKLKYELEKNVNLVSFEKNRIEISFNDNLDKNFVKDLSFKLFEWTGQRWIISFSKAKGEMSIKDKEKNIKTELIKKEKDTELYKNFIEKFPDANLVNVILEKDQEE